MIFIVFEYASYFFYLSKIYFISSHCASCYHKQFKDRIAMAINAQKCKVVAKALLR